MCRLIQSGQCQSDQQHGNLLHDNHQPLWIDQFSAQTFLKYNIDHRENKSKLPSSERGVHIVMNKKKVAISRKGESQIRPEMSDLSSSSPPTSVAERMRFGRLFFYKLQ